MQMLPSNKALKPISVSGIHTRRGRPPKWLSFNFDQVADKAFTLAGKFMEYANANWDSLTHAEKVSTMQIASPIALKRIPDKQEVVQFNLSASDDEMKRLLALAAHNISSRSQVIHTHQVPKASPQVVDGKQVTDTAMSDEKVKSGATPTQAS